MRVIYYHSKAQPSLPDPPPWRNSTHVQKELQGGIVIVAVLVTREKVETTVLAGKMDRLWFNHIPEYYTAVK